MITRYIDALEQAMTQAAYGHHVRILRRRAAVPMPEPDPLPVTQGLAARTQRLWEFITTAGQHLEAPGDWEVIGEVHPEELEDLDRWANYRDDNSRMAQ